MNSRFAGVATPASFADLPFLVKDVHALTSDLVLLDTVPAEALPPEAQPGQFFQILLEGGGVYLRRPFSLVARLGVVHRFAVRVVGRGTSAIARLRPGDRLRLLGPLGTGFPLAPTGVRKLLLLAGGVGAAPLASVLAAVAAGRSSFRLSDVAVVLGVRRSEEAALARLFRPWADPLLAVESLSADEGERNVPPGTFVGTALDAAFARWEELWSVPASPEEVAVFVAGPKPMLEAAFRRLPAKARVYGAFEAPMACGTGLCRGCVVETAVGNVRLCREGPVLSREVHFPNLVPSRKESAP
ncbi:MAG: hypothetical protein KM296_03330 [Brockia lithotrophica]|nr:hypothetical protein [Brockia lithotrophica]